MIAHHLGHQRGQKLTVGRRCIFGCQLGRAEFEHAAIAQQRGQLGTAQVAHSIFRRAGCIGGQLEADEGATAASATRFEIARLLQHTQSLAHGRARQRKVLGKVALTRQLLAGCEQAHANRTAEALDGLLEGVGRAHGCEDGTEAVVDRTVSGLRHCSSDAIRPSAFS